jgi:hypothetical protein
LRVARLCETGSENLAPRPVVSANAGRYESMKPRSLHRKINASEGACHRRRTQNIAGFSPYMRSTLGVPPKHRRAARLAFPQSN